MSSGHGHGHGLGRHGGVSTTPGAGSAMGGREGAISAARRSPSMAAGEGEEDEEREGRESGIGDEDEEEAYLDSRMGTPTTGEPMGSEAGGDESR